MLIVISILESYSYEFHIFYIMCDLIIFSSNYIYCPFKNSDTIFILYYKIKLSMFEVSCYK